MLSLQFTLLIDRCYYYLRLNEKPCLWVKGTFEDHRKRMYTSNIIEKIAEKLVSNFLFVTVKLFGHSDNSCICVDP